MFLHSARAQRAPAPCALRRRGEGRPTARGARHARAPREQARLRGRSIKPMQQNTTKKRNWGARSRTGFILAHAGCENSTPPLLSSPLKLIKIYSVSNSNFANLGCSSRVHFKTKKNTSRPPERTFEPSEKRAKRSGGSAWWHGALANRDEDMGATRTLRCALRVN